MPNDDEIRALISNASLSEWFRHALLFALERDPQEAAADAGLLSIVLDQRAQSLKALAVTPNAMPECKKSR